MSPSPDPMPLQQGIISVLQTPFDQQGVVDLKSLEALVEETIAAGVKGFLVPAVASEVGSLTPEDRRSIVQKVADVTRRRVPIIVGASAPQPQACIEQAQLARTVGAAAYLVAVPPDLYRHPEQVEPFFREVVAGAGNLPLMLQDLDFTGPGLELDMIHRLTQTLPTLSALKIESIPAGPKYSAVRDRCGEGIFIAGGWSTAQMIEALDRGVDAMIPESSTVWVFAAIDRHYRNGERQGAIQLFNRLQPVLGFSHQELIVSIAFGKRLLVRKGVFQTPKMRAGNFEWDSYNGRVADEIIEYYLELEASVKSWWQTT